MLYNSRANEIILNTVTKGSFRGPPIVCCSSNYSLTFNTAAWTNLQSLHSLLDVPAFHVDQAHDGGIATLLVILQNLQRFYSGQAAESWIHSSGSDSTLIPPCGPIFYFDGTSANPSTDSPGSGGAIARTLAQSCVNFRRNHLYEHAVDSVWPVLGENLDRIQRPPIHKFWTNMGTDPKWFIEASYSTWRNGGIPSTNDPKIAHKLGLQVLQDQEVTYPGISRHVLPPMATVGLFTYPWST